MRPLPWSSWASRGPRFWKAWPRSRRSADRSSIPKTRSSGMIEKSVASFAARLGDGLLDLNHTSIMIFLVSLRPRNSFTAAAERDEFRDQDTRSYTARRAGEARKTAEKRNVSH